jgi:predicted amidohydrolase YtcJ
LAAKTDASRTSSFNPWLALWWLAKGESLGTVPRRSSDRLMTRREALDADTALSAPVFRGVRARSSPRGFLADFEVLSAHDLSIALDEVPFITSELTAAGGRAGHSSSRVAESDV